MMTMGNTTRDQIDDLCDARATVRALRQDVLKKRVALVEAKDKLAKAMERMEDVLTELEQRQGRLPFAEEVTQPAAAVEAPKRRGTNGKPRRNGKALRQVVLTNQRTTDH